MKTKLLEKIALIIIVAYCVLHLFIILQIIPSNIVWGGKVKSAHTIYILEVVSLLVMSFLGFLMAMKNRIIKPIFSNKTIKVILFIFSIYFVLNTVGNLLAETAIEKFQAIVTAYFAIVFYKSSREI